MWMRWASASPNSSQLLYVVSPRSTTVVQLLHATTAWTHPLANSCHTFGLCAHTQRALPVPAKKVTNMVENVSTNVRLLHLIVK